VHKITSSVALAAAFAIAGAALSAIVLRDHAVEAALLVALTARLDRIEATVSGLEQTAAVPGPSPAVGPSETEDLARRIGALEQEILVLISGAIDTLPQPAAAETLVDAVATPVYEKAAPLTEAHADEAGVSEWGKRLAGEVPIRFGDDPFFGRFPGELATDCRQTVCKLTWFFPPEELLTREEADLMLSTVQYELASLGAEEGRGVGRFEVEWRRDAPEPHIAVYLTDSTD
jgi:hypothetical protein